MTEIYDYLRLLFARAGEPHCPQCGRLIERQTVQQIVDQVLAFDEETKFIVMAPLVNGRKGEHKDSFASMRKAGYVRVLVDGEIHTLDEDIRLDKKKKHKISVVVDRMKVREGILSAGAQLKLAPSAYDMHLIKDIMTEQAVTIWNTVPSIMELLVNNLDKGRKYESLRTVLLSGDWIPLNLPQKIRDIFPNAQVISLGGATEGSIWSIYYPIEGIEKDWNSIPYGYPLENQSIWILDDDDLICPCGIRGEICIGG